MILSEVTMSTSLRGAFLYLNALKLLTKWLKFANIETVQPTYRQKRIGNEG